MSFDDFESEKDAIDLVTNSMFSVDFLKEISDLIFSGKGSEISVSEFYTQWLANSGSKEHKIPFNLGILTSYLYTGILLTRERWFDLIPNDSPDENLADWGLLQIEYQAPKKANPSINYVIRRIRNSLGHGNIKVDVPEGIRDKSELMSKVYFEFYDVNMRDTTDTFHARANLNALSTIIRKLQGVAHKDVRERADIKA